MSINRKYYFIFILSLTAYSCEKVFFEKDKSSTDPQTNFEYIWNECNEKYSYFEVKGIDWDEIKAKYSGRIFDEMSEDSLFKVMGSMLSELRDDHTNLASSFNVSRFAVKYLGQDNFDWRIIEDNYLSQRFYSSGPFKHDFFGNKQIGYVRFPAFTGKIDPKNLSFIFNRYRDTKGLIFDLRENGGGEVRDVFELLSRLVDSEQVIFYSRIKNGLGHSDFTDPVEVKLSPSEEVRYTKKVIFLVDRGTYSAGSFRALATKAMDNVSLIGDTTGGGLGLPNGGQLPNGWRYRFSVSQTLTLEGSPEYENGVPPDLHVLMDWSNLSSDEILDMAVSEILK